MSVSFIENVVHNDIIVFYLSYFVSVVYIMMYYYTGSIAEIAFSVLQVLY